MAKKRVRYPIFTTNYDPILEAYCKSRNFLYASGELLNGRLDISSSNDKLYSMNENAFHIYKLHGSINWYVGEDGQMHWVSAPVQPGTRTFLGDKVQREMLIYPTQQKYTFREPFYTMFHHLKRCLASQDYDRCYIVGYSFRDDDILGMFHDSLE